MQKIDTAHDLKQRLTRILQTVENEFGQLSDEQLGWKPASGSWSIVECLQHLNLAERHYIRNIQHKVDKLGLRQTSPTDQPVESNLLGKAVLYAINPDVKVKLPTLGIMRPRPASELVTTDVISQFLNLQTLLRTLLDKAVYLDWNAEQVCTMYGNWLTMRLGDTLLMLVAHGERHIRQAMRVKTEMATFAAAS